MAWAKKPLVKKLEKQEDRMFLEFEKLRAEVKLEAEIVKSS